MKAIRLSRDESGSTLVEAMVALAIIAIVLVAAAYAMLGALQVQTRTESRDKAVQLVQQQLEKARQISFSELGFRSNAAPLGAADPGYADTAINGLPGHNLEATAEACTNVERIGCTVAVDTLEEFEAGVNDYQTERLVPWRELLFDEPGGVGGVDYVIRTNITYENPADYGVTAGSLNADRLAKRITVTVYWNETIDDETKVLETTMTMIRTPNPGEWKS